MLGAFSAADSQFSVRDPAYRTGQEGIDFMTDYSNTESGSANTGPTPASTVLVTTAAALLLGCVRW